MQTLSPHINTPLLQKTQSRSQSGKVVSINAITRTLIIDVGQVDSDGNAVYLSSVSYQPQSPPTVGDHIAISYSDLTGYSATASQTIIGGQNYTGITSYDFHANTIAELSGLVATAGKIAFVSDTLRGGFFVAKSGTADDGTTFDSATSGIVWSRVFQGALNPQWFGAVGDGSTDDTAAIQAAVNAVPDGGTLFFPKPDSYYKLTTAVTLGNGGGITIEGASRTVELKQVSTDTPMFNVEGDYVTVRSLKLTGRQYLHYHPYNGGENCFNVLGADVDHKIYYFTVENCDINTWGGCAFNMAFVEHIRIFDTKMRYLNDAGVLALSCNDGWILHSEIDTIVGDASPEGLVLSPNTSVYGVIISRASSSDLTAYPRPENWIVAHNKVRNIEIWEALDTHGGKNIQFSNNNIYNVRTAITINYAQDAGGTQWLAPIACIASGNICDSGVTDGSRALGIAIAGARNDFYIVTLSGSGGNSCTFSWGGSSSGAVAGNASAGTIQTAIEGIAGVGAGNVTVTADANTANTFQILFTGALSGTTTILTASGAAVTKSPTKVYEAATGIVVVGNDLRGFGAQGTQNSGAIYCTATENVNIVGNSMYRPSCCGIVLNTENKTFSLTANNITDCWSNTGGNVGMGVRIYVATGIGNNTGVISSNNFVRSDLAGVTSVSNRAIEVGNYSGNSVHIGLNTYVGHTYKILDAGNKGYTSFEERLQPNGGVRFNNTAGTDYIDIDYSTTQKIAVAGSVIFSETSDKKLRKLEGAVLGWDCNSSLTKTVVNGGRNRLALANNLSGFSVSASTAISSGSLNNLWSDDSNTATWNSLGSPITLTITVPNYSSMQVLVISQHVSYYATTCLIEYSTNSGSSYSTFQTVTGMVGGTESAIDTSTMAGTVTNIKLTFSGFNGALWQLFGIHWTHPNSPVSPWAVAKTGDTVYGNLDLNTNVASTFYTVSDRRIRLNATSTSTILAYEMSENSGEGKRARVAMTGSGSSSLMTIETDASSSTNRPNISFRAGSTEWLLITTKGTNAGRVTIQTSGSAAGLMIVDALLYRDSSGVLRTSGSLTVDSVFKHSGSTLGFFSGTPATKQTLSAYTTNAQSSAYTGIDNAQAGTVYAQLTDLNALRVGYENMRAMVDDMRTKIQATTLVA